MLRYSSFQSTHPLGVRHDNGNKITVASTVSIHAPTRGATYRCTHNIESVPCFNPRTHSGCDSSVHHSTTACVRFQSTHPLGVRRFPLHRRIRPAMFQSTHPLGVRQNLSLQEIVNVLFQSTHPLGVRPFSFASCLHKSAVSIHAPTRGATLKRQSKYFLSYRFNPRTHSGCDCIFSNRLNITMQR